VRPWTQAAIGLALVAAGVAALTLSGDLEVRARRKVFDDFRAYERLSQQVGSFGRCHDPSALVSPQTRVALRRVLQDVDLPLHFSRTERFGYRFVFFGEGQARTNSPAFAAQGLESFADCTWVATPVIPEPGLPTFTYFSSRPGRAFVRSDGLRATVDDPSLLLTADPLL
jgi:hypothetical protein